jgi:hypothetical protein
MNKYHLLLPAVIAALSGCYSDLHYQEQAVESARKFIFENARELTPEQYAFVKLTPPVLFTGNILNKNGGSGRIQVCIAWRIPEQKNDYLVFGVTDAVMNNWRPARLIRRPIAALDQPAWAALKSARTYAVAALKEQMSVSELNRIRFSHPELVLSAFELGTLEENGTKNEILKNKADEEQSVPRPWKKYLPPPVGKEGNVQLSLLWKLDGDRYAVFCGVSQVDMKNWEIAMAGVFQEEEVKKARLEVVKTSDKYLFPRKKKPELQSAEPQIKPSATSIPVPEKKKTVNTAQGGK